MSNPNASCRKCGKEAIDACSSCKDARYCSKKCQRWDWKIGGHKALCRGPSVNRKIRAILQELFLAEWQWLQSLSLSEKELLFREDSVDAPPNHLFVAGRVALVLARANAAAILSINHVHTLSFGTEYYENVIAPWYETHKAFLNEQGFVVEHNIPSGVHVWDWRCSCKDENGELCGKMVDCVRGALIKDTRSPKTELVDKVFTLKRPATREDWSEEDKTVTRRDLMRCTSVARIHNDESSSPINVCYNFHYPKQVFGDANVCCSPCYDMSSPVDPRDAVALGMHFHRCFTAMAELGLPLALDILFQDEWSDRAIAEAWYTAAGCDYIKITSWLQEEIGISIRVDSDRIVNIVSILQELDGTDLTGQMEGSE